MAMIMEMSSRCRYLLMFLLILESMMTIWCQRATESSADYDIEYRQEYLGKEASSLEEFEDDFGFLEQF